MEAGKKEASSHGHLAVDFDNLALAGHSISAPDAFIARNFLGAFDLPTSTRDACPWDSLGLSHWLWHG